MLRGGAEKTVDAPYQCGDEEHCADHDGKLDGGGQDAQADDEGACTCRRVRAAEQSQRQRRQRHRQRASGDAGGCRTRDDGKVRPWGAELHLRLQDLPVADGFAAYAVDGSGERTLAATWGPTPGRQAQVPASTALSPEALSGLVIETTDGDDILVLEP